MALGISGVAGAAYATGVTLAKHGSEPLGRIFYKIGRLVNR